MGQLDEAQILLITEILGYGYWQQYVLHYESYTAAQGYGEEFDEKNHLKWGGYTLVIWPLA